MGQKEVLGLVIREWPEFEPGISLETVDHSFRSVEVAGAEEKSILRSRLPTSRRDKQRHAETNRHRSANK